MHVHTLLHFLGFSFPLNKYLTFLIDTPQLSQLVWYYNNEYVSRSNSQAANKSNPQMDCIYRQKVEQIHASVVVATSRLHSSYNLPIQYLSIARRCSIKQVACNVLLIANTTQNPIPWVLDWWSTSSNIISKHIHANVLFETTWQGGNNNQD